MVWSATVVALELPSGALADRFSARSALVASGLLRAAGFGLWVVAPGYTAFLAGFVLWGAASALSSGAYESLVYDAMDSHGVADRYVRVMGRADAANLVAQVAGIAAAAPLMLLGGYALVGAISVGICLTGTLVAVGFPPGRARMEPVGYLSLLHSGVREALASRDLRRLVVAVAVLEGLAALDEFVPLAARDLGAATPVIPVVVASLPLAAALGALLAGRRRASLRWAGVAILLLTVPTVVAAVQGALLVGPLFVLWYGLSQHCRVLADAGIQHQVRGPARATVTSVAGLGSELMAILVFAAVAL